MKLFEQSRKKKDAQEQTEPAELQSVAASAAEASSEMEDLVISMDTADLKEQVSLPDAFTMNQPSENQKEDVAPERKPAVETPNMKFFDEKAMIPESEKAEQKKEAEQSTALADEKEEQPSVSEAPESETEQAEEPEKPQAPSVTYASMAEAIEQSGRKSGDPEGRKPRNDIDDEKLLAEIYALMGEQPKKRDSRVSTQVSRPSAEPVPNKQEHTTVSDRPADTFRPIAAPAVDEEAYRPQQVVYGQDSAPAAYAEEPLEMEANGAPGWVKGIFLLLISLLLSGMTLYAIATDLFGKVF